MFNRILYVVIAASTAVLVSIPSVSALDGLLISTNLSGKERKDMTPQEYYTSVKLEAAKAYSESQALKSQGKFFEASKYMRKCLAIRHYFVATDKEIPALKQKLGELLVAAGKNDEALQVFAEATGEFARWYGPGCTQSIAPLTMAGNIFLARANYPKALNNFLQAYAISQRNSGVNSPECMNLRLQLAASHKGSLQFEPAATLYAEALDRQQKNEKLIDRERLQTTLQDYATVLKELKKGDEAAKILERASAMQPADAKPGAGEDGQAKPVQQPVINK
ncbi:MAG: tetratricopeptide repeat protein [Candidatus Melainabacteria bacterium]|mgnify:CR=1 FL=1|nr:tetratricopeptide repeat protein [Candidatus Melainabacteria bacterium]